MRCKLCGSNAPLQKSHIIPRSYFKGIKDKNGQFISILCDETSKPRKTNSDPKEKLLCRNCEQFLSENYERYGTRLFKSGKNIRKNKQFIELHGFKYVDYYLYLLSILWRASVSTLEVFSKVNLTSTLEIKLAECLKTKSIKLNTSLKVDHFIRVSISRVIDTKIGIEDDMIKNVLMYFGAEKGETSEEGIAYYFMINGFFICYFFNAENDIHEVRTKRLKGQLINRPQIKIPKVEVVDLPPVYESFRVVYLKANESEN